MSEYQIQEIELSPQPALVIRFTSPPQEFGQKLGTHLPAVYGYAAGKGLAITGMPFVRYLEMTDDVFVAEAGMPVARADDGEGDIYGTELAGGPAITTDYFGAYEGLGAAHQALRKWLSDKGVDPDDTAWEVYETDPSSEPDSSKWLTRVYKSV